MARSTRKLAPQLVTGHRHSAGLEVGGLSVSGLRHLTTPQLFSLPCKGRNHGQHVPKARAALRIKPLAFCLVRHRIWQQVLEAKGLCESRLSYLTSCQPCRSAPSVVSSFVKERQNRLGKMKGNHERLKTALAGC